MPKTLAERKLDDATILAAVMLATVGDAPPSAPYTCADVSRNLAILARSGATSVSNFHLTPGGDFSDDVVRFIADGESLHYFEIAAGGGRFRCLPEGQAFIRRLVLKAAAHQDKYIAVEMTHVAFSLGIDLTHLAWDWVRETTVDKD